MQILISSLFLNISIQFFGQLLIPMTSSDGMMFMMIRHVCNLSLVVSFYDSDTLQTKKICGRRAWKEIASQVTSPDEEAQINGCQVVKT